MGYVPTEQRRFVLLDLSNVGKIKRNEFDPGANIIFSHVDKLVNDATKALTAKASHNVVIENKTKVASNKELFRLMNERESLAIQLENRMDDLEKLEVKFARVAFKLPQPATREINILIDPTTEMRLSMHLIVWINWVIIDYYCETK